MWWETLSNSLAPQLILIGKMPLDAPSWTLPPNHRSPVIVMLCPGLKNSAGCGPQNRAFPATHGDVMPPCHETFRDLAGRTDNESRSRFNFQTGILRVTNKQQRSWVLNHQQKMLKWRFYPANKDHEDLPPLVAGRKLFNLPINLGVLSKQNSQHTSLSDRHHVELVLSQLVYDQYELPNLVN
jgi:hypothetical protein